MTSTGTEVDLEKLYDDEIPNEDKPDAEAAVDALEREDARIVTTVEEAKVLYPSYNLDERVKIRLVNLDMWRLNPAYSTIDYELVNCYYEAYEKLSTHLKTYYEREENSMYLALPVDVAMRAQVELVVIRLPGGEFRRAQLLHPTDSSSWRHMSEAADAEVVPFGEASCSNSSTTDFSGHLNLGLELMLKNLTFEPEPEDSSNPRIKAVLLDTGKGVTIPANQVELYHLTSIFCKLPVRIRQLFLNGTGDLHIMNEFRDTVFSNVKERQSFLMKIDSVNTNGVPFVTLLDDVDNAMNTTWCTLSILRFRQTMPQLPPPGSTRRDMIVTHMERNGNIYLQCQQTYMFELFDKISKEVTGDIYEHHRAKGPYPIDITCIYIAPYSGRFYRCVIKSKEKFPLVEIYYVDIGNSEVIDTTRTMLVPCVNINRPLWAFPYMAMRARLINTTNLLVDKASERKELKIPYVVETLDGENEKRPPLIELLDDLALDGKIRRLSKLLQRWKLSTKTGENIPVRSIVSKFGQACMSYIPKIPTNWGPAQGTIVVAEPGAILFARVLNIPNADTIIVAPHLAEDNLNDLQTLIRSAQYWQHFAILKNYASYQIGTLGRIYTTCLYSKAPPLSPLAYFQRVIVNEDRKDNDSMLEVYFVDLGYFSRVEIIHLHFTVPEFWKLPPQAVRVAAPQQSSLRQLTHLDIKKLNITLQGNYVLVKVLEQVLPEPYPRLTGEIYELTGIMLPDGGPIFKSISHQDANNLVYVEKSIGPDFFDTPRGNVS